MLFQIGCFIVCLFGLILLYKIYNAIIDIRVDNSDYWTNRYETEYWVNKELGNREKEYEALLMIFYSSLLNPILKSSKKKRYEELKQIYAETFIALNKPFPKYTFLDE
jgi:hypothetical protein